MHLFNFTLQDKTEHGQGLATNSGYAIDLDKLTDDFQRKALRVGIVHMLTQCQVDHGFTPDLAITLMEEGLYGQVDTTKRMWTSEEVLLIDEYRETNEAELRKIARLRKHLGRPELTEREWKAIIWAKIQLAPRHEQRVLTETAEQKRSDAEMLEMFG